MKPIYQENVDLCYLYQTLNMDVLKDMSKVNINGKTLMFLPTINSHRNGIF